MKRIYACIAIVAVLLGVAFYSSWKVQSFAEVISADLDAAAEAIRNADHPAARQALADGAARCDQMRTSMNHLLRTADFTELEAALRAADGHLEMNAPEEAFGELRRAPGTGGNAGMALPPAGMTKSTGTVSEQAQFRCFWGLFCYFCGSLRSPISFCNSLKKLSTSANWR